MDAAPVKYSTSTWQQPIPPAAGPNRSGVVERVADMIASLGPRRLRVVIDGATAAGKTSLGHELAVRLAERGRPVFRASLDDFKRPWSEADRYDRRSGAGYYRNAWDFERIRHLLLEPADPTADGRVALCSIDPITQLDHSHRTKEMPANGVLIVDGVFACRPELDEFWDLRVWVEIAPDLSVARAAARDAEMEAGRENAARLTRDRYLVAEALYVQEVDPRSFADVVIDNSDFARPRLLRPQP